MEIYTNIFHTTSNELLSVHIETILAILFDSNQSVVKDKVSFIDAGGFNYTHNKHLSGSVLIQNKSNALEFAKNWMTTKNEAIAKSMSSFKHDFKFNGTLFPIQYLVPLSVLSKSENKAKSNSEVIWEINYKIEIPAFESEDQNTKSEVYNAGIKLVLGANGKMQGIEYNFLPIERVQKTMLNKVLTFESDEPELTYMLNHETNSIVPFYYSPSDLRFIQATIDSHLPSNLWKIKKSVKSAYERNYEEKIGLTTVPGKKGKVYEDYFIEPSTKVKEVVDAYMTTMPSDTTKSFSSFDILVKEYAEKLWKAAIDDAKSNPDDRALYWARIKMQVALKSHPIFMRSGGKRKLNQMIASFEEKSRNYTGIDFSEADKKGLKKILITGFDPFFLNEKHPIYGKYSNILQSNPSGCVALKLHNTETLNGIGFIQAMIIPVRYSDFDSSLSDSTGQGEGIIEKYIQPLIDEADVIITISQAGPDDYHIDVFATATRGGLIDNLGYTRTEASKSINNSSAETIVTTLPDNFTQSPSRAIFYGKYFKTLAEVNKYRSDIDSSPNDSNRNSYPIEKTFYGPGGNYLSNEIFYRVAKLREDWIKSKLPTVVNKATGHFHIAKLQDPEIKEDISKTKTQTLLDIVKTTINEGITGL